MIDDQEANILVASYDTASDEEKQQIGTLLGEYNEAWRRRPEQEAYRREIRDYYRNPDDLGGHWSNAMQERLGPFQSDPKESRVSWANVGFLAEAYGKTREELAPVYEQFRDDFAQREFNGKLDNLAFYNGVKGLFETKENKDALAAEMKGDALNSAFVHAVDGLNPNYSEPHIAWREQARGKPGFEDRPDAYLEDYTREYIAGYRLARENRDLFAVARALLVKQTGREGTGVMVPETEGPALEAAATRLNSATPEEQKAVFGMLSAWAKANFPENPSGAIAQIGEYFRQFAQQVGRGADALKDTTIARGIRNFALDEKLQSIQDPKQVVWVKDGAPSLATATTEEAVDATDPYYRTKRSFLAGQGYREATPEERAAITKEAQGALSQMALYHKLKRVAEQEIDPVRPVMTYAPDVAESGFMVVAESVPQMAATLVPVAGLPWAASAMGNQVYGDIRTDYPDIPAGKAALIASISGPAMAALDRFQVGQAIGKMPAINALFGKIITPKSSMWLRAPVSAVGQTLTQHVEEAVQDSMPALTQNVVAAFSEDVPEVDWSEAFAKTFTSPEALFASAFFGMIGAGVVTAQENRAAARLISDPVAMMGEGIPQAQAEAIAAAAPEERQAAFQTAWKERTAKEIEKGSKMKEVRMKTAREIFDSPATPTIEPFGEKFRVVNPDGTVRATYDTLDGAISVMANDMFMDEEARAQAVRDLAAAFNTPYRKFIVSNKEAFAGGSKASPETIAKQMRIAGYAAGADPSKVRVFGSNVGKLAGDIYTSVSQVFQGATPFTVIHERTHDQFKAEMEAGTISFADGERAARAWLGEKAPATLSEEAIHEAVAEMGEAYFAGNWRKLESLPASVRAFLARMAIFFREVFQRAAQLVSLQKAGKLDADWQAFLARAVGVNENVEVNRATESAAAELEQDSAATSSQSQTGIGGDAERQASSKSPPVEKTVSLAKAESSGESFSLAPATNSPEFKRWFGESKVVDADGKPLVVYHGTSNKFTKFNTKKMRQGLIWFTSSKEKIESGEVGAEGREQIMELFASIQNPAGWEEYDKLGLYEFDRNGLDGAILPDGKGGFDGFVFESSQVKSATKNKGAFDRKNPNINFSIAPANYAEKLAARFDALRKSPGRRIEIYSKAKRLITDLDRSQRFVLGVDEAMRDEDQTADMDVAAIRQELEDKRAELEAEKEAAISEMGQANLAKYMDRIEAAKTARGKRELEREARVRGQEKVAAIENQFAEKKKAAEAASKAKERAFLTKEKGSTESKSARTKLLQAFAMLEAIVSAMPKEIRAEIGGGSYAQLVKLTTSAARTKWILNRIDKIDAALEKLLKKDYTAEIEAIFKKAQPKSKSGEATRGKLGAFRHGWFAEAERVSELTETKLEAEEALIEAKLSGEKEITPDDIKELNRIFDGVTDEDTARSVYEVSQVILENFGDLKHRTAGELASAVELAKGTYLDGRIDWQKIVLERSARRTTLRESAVEELGGIPATSDELDDMIAARKEQDRGLSSKTAEMFAEGHSFEQKISDVTGEGSQTHKWAERLTLKSTNAERDAMARRQRAFADFIRTVFPGSTRNRLRALEKLAERRELVIGKRKMLISELEAAHYTMLWSDPDSRAWLEEHGYGADAQQAFEEFISPETHALRGWVVKEYDAQYDYINAVYKRARGVNMPRVRNYAPRLVDFGGDMADMALTPETMAGTMGSGFTKRRVRKPGKPPLRTDMLSAYWQNAFMVEHWVNWMEAMGDLRSVFMHHQTSRAMRAHHGETAAKDIAEWLRMLDRGGVENARGQGLLRRFVRGLVDNALVLKLSVLAKQLPATYAAAAKIGLSEWMAGASRVLSGGGSIPIGEMMESRVVQRRIDQYPPEMRQALAGAAGVLKGASAAARALGFDPRAVELMLDTARQSIGFADAIFTGFGATVVYDVKYQEATKAGLGAEEAAAYAMEETESIIETTAQPQTLISKSLFESRLGAWGRLFFMFQSANRQAFAITALAFKQGRTTDALRAMAIYWVTNGIVLQTVANLVRWGTSDDDWEDSWDITDYIRSIAMGPLAGAVWIGPLADAAMNALVGGYEPRIASPSASFFKALRNFKEKDFDLGDAGEVTNAASALIGGNWAAAGVTWNAVRQLLGIMDAITPGDQETISRARK